MRLLKNVFRNYWSTTPPSQDIQNPNLGVTYYDGKEVTLADIPGLVEGAHKGIGLGDKFLRHIERCKVLLHLIDISDLAFKKPGDGISPDKYDLILGKKLNRDIDEDEAIYLKDIEK